MYSLRITRNISYSDSDKCFCGRVTQCDVVSILFTWIMTYSEPCQTSKIDNFAKTIIGRAPINYLGKPLHLRGLTRLYTLLQ